MAGRRSVRALARSCAGYDARPCSVRDRFSSAASVTGVARRRDACSRDRVRGARVGARRLHATARARQRAADAESARRLRPQRRQLALDRRGQRYRHRPGRGPPDQPRHQRDLRRRRPPRGRRADASAARSRSAPGTGPARGIDRLRAQHRHGAASARSTSARSPSTARRSSADASTTRRSSCRSAACSRTARSAIDRRPVRRHASARPSTGSNWLFTRANGIVDMHRWIPWISRKRRVRPAQPRRPVRDPGQPAGHASGSAPTCRSTLAHHRRPDRHLRRRPHPHLPGDERARLRGHGGRRLPDPRGGLVGDTSVRVVSRPGFPAGRALDAAANALRKLEARLGPYPYRVLRVVQSAGALRHGGPGHRLDPDRRRRRRTCATSSPTRSPTSGSTGIVGNDQAREPFADEAPTDFVARYVLGLRRGVALRRGRPRPLDLPLLVDLLLRGRLHPGRQPARQRAPADGIEAVLGGAARLPRGPPLGPRPHADAARRPRRGDAAQPRPTLALAVPEPVLSRWDAVARAPRDARRRRRVRRDLRPVRRGDRRSRSSSSRRRPTRWRARIARTIDRTPWLVAEVDGVVRGYAYGTRHRDRAAYDWTVETTVYVDAAFAGRGLGRATMTALLDDPAAPGLPPRGRGRHASPTRRSTALHRALGLRADRRVRGDRLEVRGAGTASSGSASSSGRATSSRTPIRAARRRDRRAGGRPLAAAPERERPRPLAARPAASAASACGNQRQRPAAAPAATAATSSSARRRSRARAAPRRGRTRRARRPAAGRSPGRAASRRPAAGIAPRTAAAGPAQSPEQRRDRPGPTSGASGGWRITPPARGRSRRVDRARRAPASRRRRRRRRRCRAGAARPATPNRRATGTVSA